MIRMNKCLGYALTLILCTLSSSIHARLHGNSFLQPRSQTTNIARHAVMWHDQIYQVTNDNKVHGGFTITPAYYKSYKECRLAQYFFGTNLLSISGSMVTTRDEDDILADYFGLSPSFASKVVVSPFLRNAMLEGSLHLRYNNWYFQLYAPLVWANTEINLCEKIETLETTNFPVNYMAAPSIVPPFHSFTRAIQGMIGFGDVMPRVNGNIWYGCEKQFALSDPQINIGYAIIGNDYTFLGLHAILGIPTGTRPNSKQLLQPTIGNGKHWEFGLGLVSHWLVWEKDGQQTVDIAVDFNMTHLFAARQRRSFDFRAKSKCNSCPCSSECCANGVAVPGLGFGSRYTLVKQFDEDGNYTGTIFPAINLTTLGCDVSTRLQVDAMIMATYRYNAFNFDFGYNGWIRTREQICNIEPCPCNNTDNRYGFKGIQNATGNATQSFATIHGNPFEEQSLVADSETVTFSKCRLDTCSAANPHVFTNKFFWAMAYAPQVKPYSRVASSTVVPLIGVGSEVEFEGIWPRNVQPYEIGISQWGVWMKVGCVW